MTWWTRTWMVPDDGPDGEGNVTVVSLREAQDEIDRVKGELSLALQHAYERA